MKYIIEDDFCNVLQFNGKFNFGCYGKEKGVPMTFESFDEAIEFCDEKFGIDHGLTIEEFK